MMGCRIPFYYVVKTIFLLYLALPQTRGASYLYTHHLQPFFHTHESQIDATIASLKVRVYTFLQERLRALWDQAVTAIRQQQQQQVAPGTATGAESTPVVADPAPGPAQLALNLWRSYGPGIIATGTALLRQTPAVTASNTGTDPAIFNSPAAVAPVRAGNTQSILERRKQLEAELAALSKATADTASEAAPASVPMPMLASVATFTSSRTSSSSDVRERAASNGKFEEIDMPSDLEGYDGGSHGGDRGSGSESGHPNVNQRTSWFGWGGTGQTKGKYERVKTE